MMHPASSSDHPVVRLVLESLPTFVSVLAEAKASPRVAEWDLESYNKAVKWAEYFEKAIVRISSPDQLQVLDKKLRNFTTKSQQPDLEITSATLSRARFLLFGFLVGNCHTPKTLFTQVVSDHFASTAPYNSEPDIVEHTINERAHTTSVMHVLMQMHFVLDTEEDTLTGKGDFASDVARHSSQFLSSPLTIRNKSIARLALESYRQIFESPTDTRRKWILDGIQKHLEDKNSLEVVFWMISYMPFDSIASSILLNILMSLSDHALFLVHPWLLAEVSNLHFPFFDMYLARLFVHVQHALRADNCDLPGQECSISALKLRLRYLSARSERIKAVLQIVVESFTKKNPQSHVAAFFEGI